FRLAPPPLGLPFFYFVVVVVAVLVVVVAIFRPPTLQTSLMQASMMQMLRHGRAPTGLESVDFPTSSSLIKPLMLIWCHERCHKSENEARRDAFQASATLVGAQALLCKKTKQFAQWLESPTGEQRYVL
ncbi:unnamed protein product, partial [Polarella glacialis]